MKVSNMSRVRISIDVAIFAFAAYGCYSLRGARQLPPSSATVNWRSARLADLVRDAGGRGLPKTVLIAMSSDCVACRADLPVFRDILNVANERTDQMEVFFVTPNEAVAEAEFLRRNQVDGARVVT